MSATTHDRPRALDHLELVARAVAQREVAATGGVAILDDPTPRLWGPNHVIASASHPYDAQELADGCAVVSAEAGLGHRMVVIPDEAEADRLRDGFGEVRGGLDRPPVKRPRRAFVLTGPWGGNDVAEQVLLRDRLIDEHVDDQGFAAFVDGRP